MQTTFYGALVGGPRQTTSTKMTEEIISRARSALISTLIYPAAAGPSLDRTFGQLTHPDEIKCLKIIKVRTQWSKRSV
jgi:hypothetical protein